MMLRAACAAAAAVTLWAAPGLGAAGDARGQLEELCRADGMTTTTCVCLGDFVSENFSDREMEGAVLVLADPALSEDPLAAIPALLERGYSLQEIVDVANRVVELEETATKTCADDAPTPGPEAGAPDPTSAAAGEMSGGG